MMMKMVPLLENEDEDEELVRVRQGGRWFVGPKWFLHSSLVGVLNSAKV